MDTKDKNSDLASPGVMSPDTTMQPLMMANDTLDGAAPRTVGADEEIAALPGQKPKKSPTPLQESLRRLRRDKRAMVSLGLIILFILIPIFGPIIYQHVGGTYTSAFSGNIGPNVYHSPFHQELDRQGVRRPGRARRRLAGDVTRRGHDRGGVRQFGGRHRYPVGRRCIVRDRLGVRHGR